MSAGRGVQKGRILGEKDPSEEVSSVEDVAATGWIASVPRNGTNHDTPEETRNVWGMYSIPYQLYPATDGMYQNKQSENGHSFPAFTGCFAPIRMWYRLRLQLVLVRRVNLQSITNFNPHSPFPANSDSCSSERTTWFANRNIKGRAC